METYNGHVRTPADAILLFEACRIGLLPRVQRRLSEKERQQIKSGSVFVWDEREAGMRRWTDGKSWSASRVSGSFLTYREMEGKRGGSFPTPTPGAKRPSGKSPDGSATGDSEGEGPDGYRYKADGLMKQSFSITTSTGQHLHLISYYSRSHPTSGALQQPTADPQLRHIRPPKNMYPESSVNETTNVPAVTRGPMPGSPYASAPPQMGSPSPYPPHQRASPQFIAVPGFPPTPPYQYHAPYFPGHPATMGYPQIVYGHPVYPPSTLDRLPAHLNNPHGPPNQPFYGPPHPGYTQQYIPNPPPRALQATEHASRHAPTNGHHHVPASTAALPEQGPQLPAINGAIAKPTTPQPSENKSKESQGPADSNDAATNARNVPSINTLLNGTPTNGADVHQSASRSGSRSPGNSQRPPREMVVGITNNSSARVATEHAISKLNSTSFK